jgi:hypothetical protein
MLIGQASINLTANILSALLGLLSVFIFTRLMIMASICWVSASPPLSAFSWSAGSAT